MVQSITSPLSAVDIASASATVSSAALVKACTTLYERLAAVVTPSEAAPQLTVAPVEVVPEKLSPVPAVGAVSSEDTVVVTDAGAYRFIFPALSFTSTAK